jgi:hypothetical protein
LPWLVKPLYGFSSTVAALLINVHMTSLFPLAIL